MLIKKQPTKTQLFCTFKSELLAKKTQFKHYHSDLKCLHRLSVEGLSSQNHKWSNCCISCYFCHSWSNTLLEKWPLKYNWTNAHYITQLKKYSPDWTKTTLQSERQGCAGCVGGVWLHVHTSNIHLNIKKIKQSIIKVKRTRS